MNEELFTEIAIEAISPRKDLLFTSEKNTICAHRKDVDITIWTIKCGSNSKTFISRNGLDEVATIVIMMVDFFDGNGRD